MKKAPVIDSPSFNPLPHCSSCRASFQWADLPVGKEGFHRRGPLTCPKCGAGLMLSCHECGRDFAPKHWRANREHYFCQEPPHHCQRVFHGRKNYYADREKHNQDSKDRYVAAMKDAVQAEKLRAGSRVRANRHRKKYPEKIRQRNKDQKKKRNELISLGRQVPTLEQQLAKAEARVVELKAKLDRKKSPQASSYYKQGQQVEEVLPKFERLFEQFRGDIRRLLRVAAVEGFTRYELEAAGQAVNLQRPLERPRVAARYYVAAKNDKEYSLSPNMIANT